MVCAGSFADWLLILCVYVSTTYFLIAVIDRRCLRNDKAERPVSFPQFSRPLSTNQHQQQLSSPPLSPQRTNDVTASNGLSCSSPSSDGAAASLSRTCSRSDDDKITIDAATYRHMIQEFRVLKTMLFRLKRVVQEVSGRE